jgi:hypothetical protein
MRDFQKVADGAFADLLHRFPALGRTRAIAHDRPRDVK